MRELRSWVDAGMPPRHKWLEKKTEIFRITTCVTAIMVYNILMDIEEIIRDEIKNSQKSRYRISKDTKISQTRLCRIMQGEGISTEYAGILLEYFGYTLKKQKGRQK